MPSCGEMLICANLPSPPVDIDLSQVRTIRKAHASDEHRDAIMAVIGINTPGLSVGNLLTTASLLVRQTPSAGRPLPAAITEPLV